MTWNHFIQEGGSIDFTQQASENKQILLFEFQDSDHIKLVYTPPLCFPQWLLIQKSTSTVYGEDFMIWIRNGSMTAISMLLYPFFCMRGWCAARPWRAQRHWQDHLKTKKFFAKSMRVCGAPGWKAFCASLTDPWRDEDPNHRWPREPYRRASHGWWIGWQYWMVAKDMGAGHPPKCLASVCSPVIKKKILV